MIQATHFPKRMMMPGIYHIVESEFMNSFVCKMKKCCVKYKQLHDPGKNCRRYCKQALQMTVMAESNNWEDLLWHWTLTEILTLPFTAVRHWESYFTSLSLNFNICKLMAVPTLYHIAVRTQ